MHVGLPQCHEGFHHTGLLRHCFCSIHSWKEMGPVLRRSRFSLPFFYFSNPQNINFNKYVNYYMSTVWTEMFPTQSLVMICNHPCFALLFHTITFVEAICCPSPEISCEIWCCAQLCLTHLHQLHWQFNWILTFGQFGKEIQENHNLHFAKVSCTNHSWTQRLTINLNLVVHGTFVSYQLSMC